jgi:hypothetical protein
MLVPGGAWPQGNPVGPEFRVNTYSTNAQTVPFVAADLAGLAGVRAAVEAGLVERPLS